MTSNELIEASVVKASYVQSLRRRYLLSSQHVLCPSPFSKRNGQKIKRKDMILLFSRFYHLDWYSHQHSYNTVVWHVIFLDPQFLMTHSFASLIGSIREHGISSSSLFEFIEMLCSFECQRRKVRIPFTTVWSLLHVSLYCLYTSSFSYDLKN